MNLKNLFSPGNVFSQHKPAKSYRQATKLSIGQRLAEEVSYLETLDSLRSNRGDPTFCRALEERIVDGELLELEMQDVDEQIRRICETATARANPTPAQAFDSRW